MFVHACLVMRLYSFSYIYTIHCIHAYRMDTMRTGSWDLIWVLILSILCTNVTFYLSNLSLRHLSAFTSNIIYNLEPVYGIILGQYTCMSVYI